MPKGPRGVKRPADVIGNAVLERKFYRSFRGPARADDDAWRLIYDHTAMRLKVRHEWQTTRDSGVAEFTIDEFLAQPSAPHDALIALLFENAAANAQGS